MPRGKTKVRYRYVRAKKRAGRRGYRGPGLTDIGGLLAGAYMLGTFDAIDLALRGEVREAGETLAVKASDPLILAEAVILGSLPAIVKGVLRKLGFRIPRYL